ncbi:MAG: ATP-dependent RecD-like DNA helicase [Verrucomicrobiae bacterium]|nr:ATP-dependent RecD-like DNA helicase [Verrucomicrobiae bacterium]
MRHRSRLVKGQYSCVEGRVSMVMSESGDDSTEVGGTIQSVVFHNEENGYTIMQVEGGPSGNFTIRGKLPAATAGERIRAQGRWRDDRRFGRQFEAVRILAEPPDSPDGIRRFLSSGLIDGVGEAYAKRIVDAFGKDTFRVIEEESQRLEEVPGIGKSRRLRIKESWKKQKSVRDIMIFLHLHGLSTARALRLYKTYGDEAVNVLRADPYRLARDIPGVGFRTADEIARQMGQSPDSPHRLAAGLLHVLDEAERQGHCALPRETLLNGASELLAANVPELELSLNRLILDSRVIVESNEAESLVYPADLHAAEETISVIITRLLGAPPTLPPLDGEAAIGWFERHHSLKLSDEQSEAVLAAAARRFFVLTGGPGVGKTTILRALIEILAAKKVQPVLCAPTGRAAKRLSESTGRDAFTLHRALEYQPMAGFARSRHRPLAGDLFIVDEASMIDIRLMNAFLEALPGHASALLVGDADQLPSVGPGNLLHDLIASGIVPCARLTHIYRQSATSRIIEAAHAINEGRLPPLDNPPDADFFFLPRDGAEAIAETLGHLIRERIPAHFGFHPRDEIQVLTPMNRQSLGTRELNAMLQTALNSPGEGKLEIERFGTTFRTGDKVIQTRNNYEKEIFNGDIGHIAEITNEPVSISVVFEGHTRVVYEPGELDELALAYAVTIHKSQGSEFPAVVIPLSTQHYPLLQRNLLYTAVTRGKRLVVVVGEKRALERAVRNGEGSRRHSGLAGRLRALVVREQGGKEDGEEG